MVRCVTHPFPLPLGPAGTRLTGLCPDQHVRKREKEEDFMRHLGLKAWIATVALGIAVVVPITGWTAERCVLGELFTATW